MVILYSGTSLYTYIFFEKHKVLSKSRRYYKFKGAGGFLKPFKCLHAATTSYIRDCTYTQIIHLCRPLFVRKTAWAGRGRIRGIASIILS